MPQIPATPLSDPAERRWFTYPEEFTVEWVAGWSERGDTPLLSTKEFAEFAKAEKFRKRKGGRLYRQTGIEPDPDFPRGIAYTSQEVILVDFD